MQHLSFETESSTRGSSDYLTVYLLLMAGPTYPTPPQVWSRVPDPGCDWQPGNDNNLPHKSLMTSSSLLLLLLLLLPMRSITVALPEKVSGKPAFS
jgi:hypothetical protein